MNVNYFKSVIQITIRCKYNVSVVQSIKDNITWRGRSLQVSHDYPQYDLVIQNRRSEVVMFVAGGIATICVDTLGIQSIELVYEFIALFNIYPYL